jgi:HEAT repeat protein
MNEELGPMVDREQILEWLRAVDLSRLACTAALQADGTLEKIGGAWQKLAAAAEEMARMGLLGIVATAAEQDDVPEPLKVATGAPLRVLQGKSLEDLLERLYEDDGPRGAVRRHYAETCANLELPGKKDSVLLETLYQELPLLRELKRERLPQASGSRDRAKDPRKDDDPQPGLRAAEILSWEEQLRDERVTYSRHALEELFADFRRAVPEAATTVPRFVVLGPPGSGKTTVEQFLAYRAATGTFRCSSRRLLPVRVRLREWEAWAVKASDPEVSLPEYLAERHKDLSPPASSEQWRRWLLNSDVLLLLDGLDEIDGKAEYLGALKLALGAFPNCPTVVTCRTVSIDRHQSVCRDLPLFVLAGLDDAQRDAYIRAFPMAYPDRYDAEKLIQQLRRLPAMRPLAANPLLLSILCLVVDDPLSKVDLPATRCELYDRAVDRMLGRAKRIEVEYPGGKPDLPRIRKRRILERAALTLFAGMDSAERELTFDQASLLDALERAASAEGLAGPTDVADALLLDLTQNSGLIRGDEEQHYFFLHLTFQEFLGASCLARLVSKKQGEPWETRHELNGNVRTVRAWIDKKAWDPVWREVICMLAGRLDDAGRLLEMLSNSEPTTTNPTGDDVFRHRLALAGCCLAELTQSKRAQQSVLIDRITTDVVGLYWRAHDTVLRPAYRELERAMSALCQANGRVPSKGTPDRWGPEFTGERSQTVRLMDRVADLLHDGEWRVRAAAASEVGVLGPAAASDVILDRIAQLRHVDPESSVRYAAETAMNKLGSAAATPTFLARLADLLRDANGWVRRNAAEVVGALGAAAATPLILDLLADLLRVADSRTGTPTSVDQWEDSRVRQAAVEAIRKMGPEAANRAFLVRLADLLRHADWEVRRSAATVVANLGAAAATPLILDRLVHLLRDEDRGVRSVAADAVGDLGVGAATETILSRLAVLLNDADARVRLAAVKALGSLGSAAATSEILGRLAVVLRDVKESEVVRCEAARVIDRFGGAWAIHEFTNSIAPELREWFGDVDDAWSVPNTVKTFEVLGPAAANPALLSYLASLLNDDELPVRTAAGYVVRSMGGAAATPEFLAALAQLLRDGDYEVREDAASVVGCLGGAAATPVFLTRLAELLQDPDHDVRQTAAHAVGGLGEAAARGKILAPLAALLRDRDYYVRWTATRALGGLGPTAVTPEILDDLADLLRKADGDGFPAAAALRGLGAAAATEAILDCLADLLRNSNKRVREAAAKAIGGLGPAGSTGAILDRLPDLLGDEHADVRSAAANAVGTLGAAAATEAILDRLAILVLDDDGGVRKKASEAVCVLVTEGLRVFPRNLGTLPPSFRRLSSGWQGRTLVEMSR